jgi:hypothetical protein
MATNTTGYMPQQEGSNLLVIACESPCPAISASKGGDLWPEAEIPQGSGPTPVQAHGLSPESLSADDALLRGEDVSAMFGICFLIRVKACYLPSFCFRFAIIIFPRKTISKISIPKGWKHSVPFRRGL